MAEYAKVIVDISQENWIIQYCIPPYLTQRIAVGMQVYIPFGNRNITGYAVELTEEAEIEESPDEKHRGDREGKCADRDPADRPCRAG